MLPSRQLVLPGACGVPVASARGTNGDHRSAGLRQRRRRARRAVADRATRSPPAPACGWRSPGWPCARCPRSAPSSCRAEVLTTDAHARGHRPRRSTWSSRSSAASSRPAELILDRAGGAASRSSPPTRSCSPTSAPSCSPPPTPPVSTCSSRRPSPVASPSMRPLRESLVGEHVSRVMGIVNGTTNYILTKMAEEGWTYAEALAEAQSLGYAERDPTADVEGFDAGAKAAIIATIAFGAKVVAGDVYHEGISAITADRHRLRPPPRATSSSCWPSPSASTTASVAVRVHPAMVPDAPPARQRCATASTPCSSRAPPWATSCSTAAAPVAFPTASAVLGDVVDAAANLAKGTHAIARRLRPADRSARSTSCTHRYYVNLEVARPPRRARRRWPACSAPTRCRSARWSRRRSPCGRPRAVGAARLIFITHDATRGRRARHAARAARARRGARASARCCGSSAND